MQHSSISTITDVEMIYILVVNSKFNILKVCTCGNYDQYRTILEIRVFRFIRKIMKSDCWLCHVCLSICPSVWNFASTGQIFMKFDI